MASAPGSLAQRSSSTRSPRRIGVSAPDDGSKCGRAALALIATIGGSSAIRLCAAKRASTNCWAEYSLTGVPERDQRARSRRRSRRPRGARSRAARRWLSSLRGLQARLEALDQVGGRHHLDAERADDFDGASIDARDVRNRASRRVVHRDPPRAGQELFQRRQHPVRRTIDRSSRFPTRPGARPRPPRPARAPRRAPAHSRTIAGS